LHLFPFSNSADFLGGGAKILLSPGAEQLYYAILPAPNVQE